MPALQDTLVVSAVRGDPIREVDFRCNRVSPNRAFYVERSCWLFARTSVGRRTITLAEGRASKTCTLALVDRDTTL